MPNNVLTAVGCALLVIQATHAQVTGVGHPASGVGGRAYARRRGSVSPGFAGHKRDDTERASAAALDLHRQSNHVASGSR